MEILVAYARLPAAELYHVSGTGVAAGFGRALVFLDFPVALAALAVLLLVLDGAAGRVATAGCALAGALCAVVFWPGVVDQADLDARPINALPALGVGLTLGYVLASARLPRAHLRREHGDAARIAAACALIVLALPWIAADLGFSFDGVPVLGTLFQTGELRRQPGSPALHPAVHHGHHHGMDGTLLVLTALLLSRTLGRLRSRAVRRVLSGYLALMLCYGLGNVANDAWLEQVVKRGWTSWSIPDVTEPRLSAAWGIIVACALAIWLGGEWTRRRGERPRAAPALGP